jgi:uncharacterized membrane protein YebE (DUF533 family)
VHRGCFCGRYRKLRPETNEFLEKKQIGAGISLMRSQNLFAGVLWAREAAQKLAADATEHGVVIQLGISNYRKAEDRVVKEEGEEENEEEAPQTSVTHDVHAFCILYKRAFNNFPPNKSTTLWV